MKAKTKAPRRRRTERERMLAAYDSILEPDIRKMAARWVVVYAITARKLRAKKA